MDIQATIQKHKEEFRVDPLYRKLHQLEIADELLSDETYFTEINMKETYSSKHAAQILKLEGREQTLVNYLNREDLKDYLSVYRQGRFYRYDWISIFKFKMIVLLIDKGYTPIEIATIAGNRVEFTQSTTDEENTNISYNGQQHEQVTRKLIDDVVREHTINQLNSIHSYVEYKQCQTYKNTIQSSIEHCEMNIKSLEMTLEDRELYTRLFEMTASSRTESSQGFISRLFGKKNPVVATDDDGITRNLDLLNANKEQMKNQIVELNEKLLALRNDLNDVNEQLLSLRSKAEKDLLENKRNEKGAINYDGETGSVYE